MCIFFRYAKDLDALRFRAPTEINTVIVDLAKEFHCSGWSTSTLRLKL